MIEKELHNLLKTNKDLISNFLTLLNFPDSVSMHHEYVLPNNIYADLVIKLNSEILSLVELKGGDIGSTEFIRGIGQIYQYNNYAKKGLSLSKDSYSDNAFPILCFPSSLLRNSTFNVGLFDYPKNTVLIEVNEHNFNPRIITESELIALSKSVEVSKTSISQYYIRDNRIFEIHLALKYLQILKNNGNVQLNRALLEANFLSLLNTPNNSNWRNAFITLSSLGLINDRNIPNLIGEKYAKMNFPEFAAEMYISYFKDYIDLIFGIILKHSDKNKIILSLNDLHHLIDIEFNGKKVLFLTDSENRYLSSWMNIMRDDFGVIDFYPRNDERKIRFNINQLKQSELRELINENYYEKNINLFYEKFEELIKWNIQ